MKRIYYIVYFKIREYLREIKDLGFKKATYWFLRDASGYAATLRFIGNLKRGFAYFKQGFSSHDYDYYHLIDDFCFKLNRIADHLADHNLHTNSQKYAKQMRHTVFLLKRVASDDYYSELMKPIEKQYGKHRLRFHRKKRKDGYVSSNFVWSKRGLSKKDIKKADALLVKALDESHKQSQRDWNAAWNIVKRNAQGWWD